MKNVRLTNSNILKISKSPSGGTKKYLWDLLVRGFGAYKTAAGRVVFVYQYKTDEGRTTSSKIGEAGEMTVEMARDIAADYARDRRQGIDPFAKRRRSEEEAEALRRLTIGAYLDDFLARKVTKGNPMSPKSERTYRRDLVPYIGEVRLDLLTPKIIDDFGQKLVRRGQSVVRIGYGCLKTIINDAVRRGTIQRSVAHDFELPAINKRTRRLTDTEFARVYEAGRDLEDVRADAFEMELRTGKRNKEVAGLPWDEIDLEKREWKLPGTRNKSKRNALILLPHQVVELLERVQPNPAKRHGPVFTLDGIHPVVMGSQVKDLVDANLHRRLEAAAPDGKFKPLKHWCFHDTRKNPTSTLRELPYRYSRDIMNALLVHKVGGDLDETYMLTELVEEVGEALQKWNDHMDMLITQPGAWPGGRRLPRMKPAEQARRIALLREGWPKRADQQRAAAVAAEDKASIGPGGASAARKRRWRNKTGRS